MDKQILLLAARPDELKQLTKILSQRPHWQIKQATDLKTAAKSMCKHPPDLLILDLDSFPHTQIQTFLQLSHDRCPQTARILLLKKGCEAMLVQSLSYAHQAIQKPFEETELIGQIQSILTLKVLLTNPALQNLVARIGTLPSPPSSYTTLIKELENPETSIKRIGQIISQDAAMTLKVLQLVNSPFFGLSRKITSSEQAIHFLGLEIIRALSLSIHIFNTFKGNPGATSFINTLFEHGLQVATLAKSMGEAEGFDKEITSQLFLTALVHDVGKLILSANLPQYHKQVISMAHNQGISLFQAEERILGCSHCEVGAYLLALWGIPEPIVLHVANFHLPELIEQPISVPGLAYFANIITNQRTPRPELLGETAIFPEFANDKILTEKILGWQDLALGVGQT